MFLQRKFSAPTGAPHGFDPPVCVVLPDEDWSCFSPHVHDVLTNIQTLLKARRRYDHVLPDYGLTASEGQFGNDAQVERILHQLPETLERYEPRFQLTALDYDVDDNGVSFISAVGTIREHPGSFSFAFAAVSRLIFDLTFTPPAVS